jgi:hypothetical protein
MLEEKEMITLWASMSSLLKFLFLTPKHDDLQKKANLEQREIYFS